MVWGQLEMADKVGIGSAKSGFQVVLVWVGVNLGWC